MMLKINKTLPKNKARQYNKSDNISTNATNVVNTHHSIVYRIALVTLICGIMPELMGLSYYSNGSSFGFSSNKAYAAETKTLSDITTMQEITPNICNNTAVGVPVTLTDTRDGATYTVAKLSDGKCWMTQNLRLAGGTELSRTDTDLDPSVYTTDEQTYILPPATDGGFSNTMFADSADTETYMNHQVRNSVDDDYGAYYSWCAATAGTCQVGSYTDIQPKEDEESGVYYTASPANSTAVPTNSQATSSICPKGWRLPTSRSTGDFQTLYRNYPNATPAALQANSNKNGYWLGGDSVANGGTFFQAAGSVYTSNSLRAPGYNGFYWSSVAYKTTIAYVLYFSGTSINPSSNDNRFAGFSIRCVADAKATEEVNVVAVKVPPVISIDAATGANVEVDPNVVSTDGTITATISANTTYDVLLSANKTALTLDNDEDDSLPNIPTTSSTNPVQARTNAWGILNSDNTTYAGITTKPTNYYNTSVYNEDDQSTTHTFHLGISVVPSLPAGEYSTTVTVTAVNN